MLPSWGRIVNYFFIVGSGKSVFLNKDIEDKFEIMEPTLGVTFSTKKLNIGNLEIELKIWDTVSI